MYSRMRSTAARKRSRSKLERTGDGASRCRGCLPAALGAVAVEAPLGRRDGGAQPGLDLGQASDRRRVGRVQVGLLVAEDVGEQGDGVAQVVEHHDDVGEQEGHVGQAQVVGRRVGQVLHVAHAVVAEVAHGAAHEGRQPLAAAAPGSGSRCSAMKAKGSPPCVGQVLVGVDAAAPDGHGGAGQADALPGLDAQEGVAPEPQALLGALQQEAAGRLAQLEKGRDRGLGVVEERVRDRDDVIACAQLPRLFA